MPSYNHWMLIALDAFAETYPDMQPELSDTAWQTFYLQYPATDKLPERTLICAVD